MPATSPPPELPAMPEAGPALTGYLRRFALWSLGNFNNCLTLRTANGELYLQSPTGATVWKITVDDSGTLKTTQLKPGMM
jgi:hypothetical protein